MNQQNPLRVTGRIQHPCPELLLRIACFDAYALALEFFMRNETTLQEREEGRPIVDMVRTMNPKFGYHQNQRHVELKASCYSDDTERAIGNVRALLEPQSVTREMLASIYVDEFNRSGRRKGYARGFQVFLESVKNGKEFLAKIRSSSCRNGAMMGAGVFGVLPSIEEVLHAAAVQASVTHNTRCGIFTARVAALATHFAFYHHDGLHALRAFLMTHEEKLAAPFANEEDCGHMPLFHQSLETPWRNQIVSMTDTCPLGLATVQSSLTIASQVSSLRDGMDRCLNLGGDTDSVAAVIASIMAPRHRAETLPAFLERDLEFCSPWTGTPRLLELGGALMCKYG